MITVDPQIAYAVLGALHSRVVAYDHFVCGNTPDVARSRLLRCCCYSLRSRSRWYCGRHCRIPMQGTRILYRNGLCFYYRVGRCNNSWLVFLAVAGVVVYAICTTAHHYQQHRNQYHHAPVYRVCLMRWWVSRLLFYLGVLFFQLFAVADSRYACRCVLEIGVRDKCHFPVLFCEFPDIRYRHFFACCQVFAGLYAVVAQAVGCFRYAYLLISGNEVGQVIIDRSALSYYDFVRRRLQCFAIKGSRAFFQLHIA